MDCPQSLKAAHTGNPRSAGLCELITQDTHAISYKDCRGVSPPQPVLPGIPMHSPSRRKARQIEAKPESRKYKSKRLTERTLKPTSMYQV
jgi:hypothetical protein